MADANPDDPHDLGRFVQAQEGDYQRALSEVRAGRKRSHWMWYIFPQFEGLGFSPTSRRYSIKSVAEARARLHGDITAFVREVSRYWAEVAAREA